MPETMRRKSIWEGVYGCFGEVPESAAVFNDSIWVGKQQDRVLRLLSDLRSDAPIPQCAVSRDYPLSAMVSVLLTRKKKVRVIDFGGSMGQSYLELLAKVPNSEHALDYTVVETKAVVENIPDEISAFANISFVDDVKKIIGTADVVHIGSALQYIDDWQGALKNLINQFDPEFFILSDLLVGDVPSFVTAQDYYGRIIPVRFINAKEFLGFWSLTGYDMIYRSYFKALAGDEYFPNHGLPETHRLRNACHIVFSKANGNL